MNEKAQIEEIRRQGGKICEGRHDFRQDPDSDILWCLNCDYQYSPWLDEENFSDSVEKQETRPLNDEKSAKVLDVLKYEM